MRIWGAIIILVASLLFLIRFSLSGLGEMAPSFFSSALVLTEDQDTKVQEEVTQILAVSGGINEYNVDAWPDMIETLREDASISDEAIEVIEKFYLEMLPVFEASQFLEMISTAVGVVFLLHLVCAVLIFCKALIPPSAVVAAFGGIALIASLAVFWAGPFALVLAIFTLVGAVLAYAGHRVEQRVAGKAAAVE